MFLWYSIDIHPFNHQLIWQKASLKGCPSSWRFSKAMAWTYGCSLETRWNWWNMSCENCSKSPINGNVTGRILELNGGFSSTPLYRRVKCLEDLFWHAHPYSMHIDLYKGTSLTEKTLFTIKCDFVSCTDPYELEITTWLLWHDYYPLNG
jgi:hypothetical protein